MSKLISDRTARHAMCAALALGFVACSSAEEAELWHEVAGLSRALEYTGSSQTATWTCTGSPCPWGDVLSGGALVWPAAMQATGVRLGYSVTPAIYLPAAGANGVTLTITSGSAALYAGGPSASSHRFVQSMGAGDSWQISGIGAGEVLSVQSDGSFGYAIDTDAGGGSAGSGAAAGSGSAGQAGSSPAGSGGAGSAAAGSGAAGSGGAGAGAGPGSSVLAEWACTGSPCPWGDSTSGHALPWSASLQPSAARFGYTTTPAVYLPASVANGSTLGITSGSATVYAGAPNASSHRWVQTLSGGASLVIDGIADGEVISVQSDQVFGYTFTRGSGGSAGAGAGGAGGAGGQAGGAAGVPGSGPWNYTPGDPLHSFSTRWVCTAPGCTESPWTGSVIGFPSWAAYQTNARSGYDSRKTVTTSGEPIYPYMGSWADGCQVTALSGSVLIIEWLRGSNQWRETTLDPGEVYTINLVSPEDGAMIENNFDMPFSVSLHNCTPRAI